MPSRTPAPPLWLAEVQQAPDKVPPKATRPAPLLFDARNLPITSTRDWQVRREELAGRWRSFLGAIEAPRALAPPRVLEEDRPEGVIRQLIQYEAEPGRPVEGYLLRPEGAERGREGVVVFHSTADHTIRQPAGLQGFESHQIGLQLARRGFVAFCPRCFLWQYGRPGHLTEAVDWLHEHHPGVSGMGKMLFDGRRAVDFLVSQPDVDPRRIGAIGHSLGAKEVLYLAAFDDRVRAAVSSEGGIGLTYSNWEAPWYLGEAIRQPGFPLEHGQVLALAAPRAFLLIGGDSADGAASWPYVEAVLPVWTLLGAPTAVGLLDHHQGHAFPSIAQARSAEWLEWWLRPDLKG